MMTKYVVIAAIILFAATIGSIVSYTGVIPQTFAPFLSPALGFVGALLIPLWSSFIQAADLQVEINSVAKTVSDVARVSINEDVELAALKLVRRFMRPEKGKLPLPQQPLVEEECTLDEAEYLLELARKRRAELPTEIQTYTKIQNDLSHKTDVSIEDIKYYNSYLAIDVLFSSGKPDKTLEDLKTKIGKVLFQKQNDYDVLRDGTAVAERRMEKVRKYLNNNRSTISLSVSLVNSGGTNTAMRVPALLRIYMGHNSYVDVRLGLEKFEQKCVVKSNSTNIVTFRSAEISALPEDDRKLLNNHWGETIPCRLFVEDISSNIHTSPPIAFAEGLNQKMIYDRLAAKASSSASSLKMPFVFR